MSRFKRVERVNEQLRQEIALLIRAEVRDPRIGMVTVTEVKASPELDHARVYVTVLGDEQEQTESVAALQRAAPFLRGQLGRRLHMRRIPELHFQLDTVLEQATRIELLLREVRPEPELGDGDADGATDISPTADDSRDA
jgi:ribosome-binding factor A